METLWGHPIGRSNYLRVTPPPIVCVRVCSVEIDSKLVLPLCDAKVGSLELTSVFSIIFYSDVVMCVCVQMVLFANNQIFLYK